MDLLDFYYRAPLWLQNAALSAYGAKLRWLRSGAVRRRVLGQLRLSQWRPAGELRTFQLDTLNQLLTHCARFVPYYADGHPGFGGSLRDLSEITRLPLITKDDVRTAGRALVSRAAHSLSLHTIHTGGTTGKPLTVYCDRAALQRNYAFFDRLREWAGVPAGGSVATFAGRPIVPPTQSTPPFWRRNFVGRALLCSSYHIGPDSIPSYLDALTQFNPDLIDSYPSSLTPLAHHLVARSQTSIHPKAVITSSETLSPEARSLIAKAFGCPVFDQYGSAEMVAFVSQCEHGTYHVNSEYGILEVLVGGRPARPGETGDLVATGFVNPTMPLIRYATGDRAVQGHGQCRCGRLLPTLERIEGRQDDVIRTPEGRLVGRLDPIFKAVSSLIETQIVQDRVDHVRVEMVATEGFTDNDATGLVRELQLRLGPSMTIELTRVPSIPRTRGGKLRSVVNLVGTDG